jgi:hypothetical protein
MTLKEYDRQCRLQRALNNTAGYWHDVFPQGLNSQGLGQGYPNNVLNPQPILVQLSDETIERVVKAILDGMQERWGRKPDET